jgi:hypothetical protein
MLLEKSKAFAQILEGDIEAYTQRVGMPMGSLAALGTSSDGAQDVQVVHDIQDVQGIKGNRGKALAFCRAYLACLGNHRNLEEAEIGPSGKDCSNLEEGTCLGLDVHVGHIHDYQSLQFQNCIQEDHGVQCQD